MSCMQEATKLPVIHLKRDYNLQSSDVHKYCHIFFGQIFKYVEICPKKYIKKIWVDILFCNC